MKRIAILLASLLGISILVNVLALQRLGSRETPAPKRASTASPGAPAGDSTSSTPVVEGGDPRLDVVLRELAQLRRDMNDLKTAGGGSRPVSPSTSPTTPGTPPGKDPKVAEILDEQDRFNKFWGELGKLSMARDQLDETKYSQAVLETTADFLGLVDPYRASFMEVSAGALTEMDRARREMNEATKNINWKENQKVAQEQYAAVSARYREQSTAAAERVKAQLDLNQPRQKQFASRIEMWLGYGSPMGGKRW